MAPKKSAKAKKEEVVEIPKTEDIANGIRTHFLGGWSSNQSFAALEDISKEKDNGDRVVVLPGVLDHAEPVSCEVRALTVVGARPPAQANAAPAANADAEGEGEAEAEAEGEAAAAAPSEPAVDEYVTVSGTITLNAWIPPVEVKAPTPPPVEEPKKDAKGKKGAKGKAAVVEEEAPPPPPPAPVEEEPKGANPSAWPTITFKDLSFRGSITAKGVHAVFENCHFIGGATHQVVAHQYVSLTFTRCTFSLPSRSCVYGFPTSKLALTDCTFTGIDLAAEQAVAASPDAEDAQMAARVAESTTAASAGSSIGIHADDCDAVATGCRFRNLAFGVLLHDKCKGAAISKCHFDRIYNTGCHVDGAAGALQGNTVKRCDYYGLVFKGKATTKVLQNDIQSKVRLYRGARPLLHTNTCAVAIQDENDVGNVYMQPSY
uniref:Right handed beta helix domain-containing protein n=1 Tax=Neobodo designis TaxID=312471 RepID=A0A7S1LI10_NEODS|mmetsp:Transcript_2225/g.6910  ORF Transcript_2225/g.6910 Transcript_2225/m.6910 type:complete len:432 (+) Transcript_2225:40-1335(+)